jgi:ribosomal protein S24E
MQKRRAKVYETPNTKPKGTWKEWLKRSWKDYSLLYIFIGQFLISLILYRMSIFWHTRQPTSEWAEFWKGFFENIQSEAFQVAALIYFTIEHIAKGSQQSHQTPEEKAQERKELAQAVAHELRNDPDYREITRQLEQMYVWLRTMKENAEFDRVEELYGSEVADDRVKVSLEPMWITTEGGLTNEQVSEIVKKGIDQAFEDMYRSVSKENENGK